MKEIKEIVNLDITGALQTPLKNSKDFDCKVSVFKTENVWDFLLKLSSPKTNYTIFAFSY